MNDAMQIEASGESIPVTEDIPAAFKAAMRRLASTVTIITAGGKGDAAGMTATAVTSLTADPPAILVCVNRSASIHPRLTAGERFCVNILAAGHDEMSMNFGGKMAPAERFASGEWIRDDGGLPFLKDAQSNLFCTVDALFDYETHSIVVGKVAAVRMHGEVRPLIYGDGRFHGILV